MGNDIPASVPVPPLPTTEVASATQALSFAQQMAITSPGELQLAAEEVKLVKERWQRLDDLRQSFVRPLNETVKKINAFFAVPLDALGKAEMAIKHKMITYNAEEQQKIDEEKRRAAQVAEKLRLEAERKAREAREKAEAEARRKREEEERQRQLADEAAARAREAAERNDNEARMRHIRERKAAEERERKAREQAEQARLEGERKAQAALNEAATAPQPVIAEAPKAEGTSLRSTWSAEVTDLRLLLAAVVGNAVPLEVVQPDMKILNRVAQALKGGMNYPGVRAIEKPGIAVSRR